MVSTNLITFEILFKNSTETFIFNTSRASLDELTNVLKDRNLLFDKVKEYDRRQSKFKRANKNRLMACIDHNTELTLILTK